ncbi:hypothetical protein TBLA_0F03670 [Henningerozyma blattae CBS 6284]|uniref:Conserved oligomeric Golgi complex subunit 3 n=1 Tax=Henningerozyma blattae (strain ATCC 34711 / CBS 6284 / DSM 70876 / NBRC 10599 / NRRL Y-10934 / UCD 77-7) TaxID=1071380 RepID=I2H6A2_HENB6|nr:hypothetical protein TBLA_0F03670 [Tetrapisispora blattae CBS 6284]CCH61904.1 hypothetical protein TBLA_0F03670 [Tetrapisispora blattae CBS 6284]
MPRARRDSLVQSIASASNTGTTKTQTLPGLLEDSYLLDQLQKLSLVIDNKDWNTIEENEVSSITAESSTTDEKAYSEPNKNHSNKYSAYTTYLEQLDSNIYNYNLVLNQTILVENQLTSIIDKFNDVKTDTTNFIEIINNVNNEYSKLNKINQDIPAILNHFEILEPIMRRLKNSSSSLKIVQRDSFKTMLKNIESSLVFLELNKNFKDYEIYRIKFKQCLIRCIELITNYSVTLLKNNFNEINLKLSKKDINSVTKDALFYNKFSIISLNFNDQIKEIFQRLQNPNLERYFDEISSLLNQCFDNYFQLRHKLLSTVIYDFLSESYKDSNINLVKFIQSYKTFFQQLCNDEFNLFIKFFPLNDISKLKINQWFIHKLCDPLYDNCRIKILKEVDIPTLCDSISLFTQYYEFEEGSDEYNKKFQNIKFDKIFEQILNKIQTRLILRTQIYIENFIINYKPTLDNFTITHNAHNNSSKNTSILKDPLVKLYLNNLKSNNLRSNTNTSMGLKNERIVSAGNNSTNDDENTVLLEEKISSYYPPLIMSLALLSKIYEMVNSIVFDDLAHHIVHDCIVSLRKAFNFLQNITANKKDIDQLDIKLSMLRNLLMLRDQIQNFNIEYTVNETYLDFSGVEEFFNSFSSNNTNHNNLSESQNNSGTNLKSFNNNSKSTSNTNLKHNDSSVSMLTMARDLVPKVVNNMVDARTELINELRVVIKDFTDSCTHDIIKDSFTLTKLADTTFNSMTLQKNVETTLPIIFEKICKYIDDNDIVINLMDAIQLVLIQSYNEFFELITSKAENNQIDKSKITEIMDSDVFFEFVNTINSKLTNSNI